MKKCWVVSCSQQTGVCSGRKREFWTRSLSWPLSPILHYFYWLCPYLSRLWEIPVFSFPPPQKKNHLIIYFLKRKSTFFFIIYPYDPLYILVQHSTTFDSRCCAVSLQFTANLQYNFPLGEVSAQRSNSQSSVCSAHISDDSTHVSY